MHNPENGGFRITSKAERERVRKLYPLSYEALQAKFRAVLSMSGNGTPIEELLERRGIDQQEFNKWLLSNPQKK